MHKKSYFQSFKDILSAPLRLTVLSDEMCNRLGLTSINNERMLFARDHCSGRLLDIGCGKNKLVKEYSGDGVGVDVFDWDEGAIILKDTAHLPFTEGSFDTVTMLASLNHVPNREEVIQEAIRVMHPNGKIVITMINPLLSCIGHRILWWYGEDRVRGMEEGEVYGFWTKDIIAMFDRAGLVMSKHRRFIYGLNNLYVFQKK